jgi:uncharacterized protein (TIGR00369 family)
VSVEQDLDPEPWNTLSGVELIRAIGDGRFPEVSHVATHVRQVIAGAEPGRVEISWTPTEELCNPGGTVHGGYIALILDNAVCLAGASTCEVFMPMLTLSLSVDYVRPVLAGETHTVVGVCVHPGRTRMLCNATVTDAGGRLVAQATASVTANQAFARR